MEHLTCENMLQLNWEFQKKKPNVEPDLLARISKAMNKVNGILVEE